MDVSAASILSRYFVVICNAIDKRDDVSPRRSRPVVARSIGGAINNTRVFLKTRAIFPAGDCRFIKQNRRRNRINVTRREPLLRSPLRISDDRGGRSQLETLARLVECGPVLLNAVNTSVDVTGAR